MEGLRKDLIEKIRIHFPMPIDDGEEDYSIKYILKSKEFELNYILLKYMKSNLPTIKIDIIGFSRICNGMLLKLDNVAKEFQYVFSGETVFEYVNLGYNTDECKTVKVVLPYSSPFIKRIKREMILKDVKDMSFNF